MHPIKRKQTNKTLKVQAGMVDLIRSLCYNTAKAYCIERYIKTPRQVQHQHEPITKTLSELFNMGVWEWLGDKRWREYHLQLQSLIYKSSEKDTRYLTFKEWAQLLDSTKTCPAHHSEWKLIVYSRQFSEHSDKLFALGYTQLTSGEMKIVLNLLLFSLEIWPDTLWRIYKGL